MISGLVISWNSEKRIRTAIDSLWKIADEVIVVDSDSVDKTEQIAESQGCKVYNLAFEKDFSKLRNFGISKAQYDYVLWLDTDEYFDSECTENLRVISQKYPEVEAFSIERKNFMDGKRYAVGDAHVRLFKSYLRFVGCVDEGVRGYSKLKKCPGFVIHEKSKEEQNKKIERRKALGFRYW